MFFHNIIPLGDNCEISIALKELGVRSKAYPFDWISHKSSEPKYSILEQNIRLFLELIETNNVDVVVEKLIGNIDENNKFNCDYIFPFEVGSKQEVKDKYTRRVKRLYSDVINKNNVNLFIMITRCCPTDIDLILRLYIKILQLNPINKLVFVSETQQDISNFNLPNLTFKYLVNNEEQVRKSLLKDFLTEELKSKNILFITAFKDINRKEWKLYNRTNQEYYECFFKLCQLIEFNLVVYLEKNICEELKASYIFTPNIIFKEFDEVNTFLKKYLEEDQRVMSSFIYKNKIPFDRKNHPEHLYSEYNLINHSKINFVRDAKETYPYYDFYSWIDFGYVKDQISIPYKANINPNKLPEKIIYQCLKYPDLNRKINPNSMLTSYDIYLTGSSFIVHKELVEILEQIWNDKIKEWHINYISDDDQNLVIQLYYDHPELFYLIQYHEWFSLFYLLPK